MQRCPAQRNHAGTAAAKLTTPFAWIQAAAEDVDRHVAGPVDAVACNSAIWQTDLAEPGIARWVAFAAQAAPE